MPIRLAKFYDYCFSLISLAIHNNDSHLSSATGSVTMTDCCASVVFCCVAVARFGTRAIFERVVVSFAGIGSLHSSCRLVSVTGYCSFFMLDQRRIDSVYRKKHGGRDYILYFLTEIGNDLQGNRYTLSRLEGTYSLPL